VSVFVEKSTDTYSLSEEGFGYNYGQLKSSASVSLNDGAKEVVNGDEFWWCYWFAYFQYFHYNFTVTRNALRKVERHEATDRFCSTVVFLLNELFVTIHVDNILNTDNNK